MATTYTQRTYTETNRAKKAWEALEAQLSQRPGAYDSKWLTQLDGVLGQILNRPAFSYDLGSDPLYRQYRDQYLNQGLMAMLDTLGQATALTGGYGNSYAQMAGQQAYNDSLQGLNALVPELYQQALDTYDRQGQQLLNNYGVLADRENLHYSRYNDNYGLWADQRDYLADRYDAERGFDYTSFRDMVADDQWLANFQEDVRRFDFANGLGEFAVTRTPVYGGSSSTATTRGKKKDDDDDDGETQTTGKSSTRIVLTDRVKPNLYTKESY